MRRVIIILILALSYLGSEAQVKIDHDWYNKHTYKLYQEKSWPRLIELGNNAIKAGYDFYYLRMRLGIAYYEQGKFRSAISHFEHALKFDINPLAVEYLYYSYKFSGRHMDANLVYTKYKKQLKSRDVSSAIGILTGLYTETGLKLLSPSNSEYGSLLYVHVGAEQQLSSRLNLYHGYMRYSQNTFQYESVPGFGPGGSMASETKRKYVQNEYYLKATVPVIKGLQVIGSLHTQQIIDTVQFNNFSYLGGLSASLKFMDLHIAYGSSRINENQHDQLSAGVTFYPAMNQNFYLESIITNHINEGASNIIFYQKIGLRAGKNAWFDFYGSFGDMRNVQELDGFYIYNINNQLNTRIGITGTFFLGKKVKLLIGYTNESYKEIDTGLPYSQHYLFTGLKILIKN
jgi:hypothetical protein